MRGDSFSVISLRCSALFAARFWGIETTNGLPPIGIRIIFPEELSDTINVSDNYSYDASNGDKSTGTRSAINRPNIF